MTTASLLDQRQLMLPTSISVATNQTNSTKQLDIAKDIFAVKFCIIAQYCVIIFVGLVGNILVVSVVARTKTMKTITNILIANLAVSDVLMCLVASPFTPLSLYMHSWTLPEALCKLLSITMGVSVYVSTLTSMAIALDRFFVIVHPFLPRMRIWLCLVIIITIWIIAILISMPLAVYQQKHWDEDKGVWACRENWPKEASRDVFTFVSFVLQFVVPCSIISFCYFRISLILKMRLQMKIGTGGKNRLKDENEIRRKRHTNSILIAMVVIFVICWIPLNVLFMVLDMLPEEYLENRPMSGQFTLIFFVCHLLAMSSAVYNPFLYALLNENFKKEVHRILWCCWCLAWRSHNTLGAVSQTAAVVEYSVLQSNPVNSASAGTAPESSQRLLHLRRRQLEETNHFDRLLVVLHQHNDTEGSNSTHTYLKDSADAEVGLGNAVNGRTDQITQLVVHEADVGGDSAAEDIKVDATD